jgi:glycine C-acetyltransferase
VKPKPSRNSPADPLKSWSAEAVEPELTAASPSTPPDGEATPEQMRALHQDYDYSNFYSGMGNDPFDMLTPFDKWWTWARPAGYYLFGQPMLTAPTTRVDIRETKHGTTADGLVNLASYNYLGLSYRPEVIEACIEATRKFGLGASGSPILSGYLSLHEELVEKLARFKAKKSVLLFPTGYSANLGIISGLMRPGDLVVADQFAHASIVDGIILSKAKARFFRHNNPEDLDRKLSGFSGKKLVVIEGVYSMDGDLAKLPEIYEVSRRHGARIMIDEAHSGFLFGENGRGVAEHFGLDSEIDVHMGTFSKSLGGMGGFVAGSAELINYLRGFARPRVFSCALAPGVVAGLIRSLEIVVAEPELRQKLHENVDFMQKLLRDAGVDVGASASQVIPVLIRDDRRIFSIVEELMSGGVYLNPVRYPAVGKHRSRVRLSVSAAHSKAQLEEAATVIIRVLRRNGLCQ